MKKLLCRLLGHVEFICKGCQENMMAIFSNEEKFREWQCSTPGCQQACKRCGVNLDERMGKVGE